jgi:23S rRNA pseudouridine1911/1915/1917 synthase
LDLIMAPGTVGLVKATYRFVTTPGDVGKRLDQVIATHVPTISRGAAKRILTEGGVFVDKRRTKVASRPVVAGRYIEVHVAAAVQTLDTPWVAPVIPLVHVTQDYVVIDKPSGVLSAPSPESNVRDVVALVSAQLKEPESPTSQLYLIHRLDRPTSGLMVLARHKAAAAFLTEQLKERTMRRKYQALLFGKPEDPSEVTLPIAGRDAHTTFLVTQHNNGVTWVEVVLGTGRTHQIRIHAEHLGAPVCGDSKYGRRLLRALKNRPPRLALHASELTFVEPGTGKSLSFSSPLPAELADWFDSLPGSMTRC